MVSRSIYLNRLVFERRSNGKTEVQLDNLPGGTKTFESVVKFCYGWKVDLTAANIGPLYCAAHFLEMTDDLEQGNLISKTEAFLSFLILTSWKDTFQICKSCEPIFSWAKELGIVKRCSEAIALNVQANNVGNWWFEDVSALRIDHFMEVIQAIKTKGVRSELVGSCIAHWTAKHMTHKLQRVTTECLIKLLPVEENSVSCNFLLHLFKLALMVEINSELLDMLERRISSMLEKCRVPDLLVKNYGDEYDDSVYDVGIVVRVVESYVSFVSSKPTPKLFVVGRLVDGYLTVVARDEKLCAKRFQSLVEALPKDARFCDDNLYTAIDMFLKVRKYFSFSIINFV